MPKKMSQSAGLRWSVRLSDSLKRPSLSIAMRRSRFCVSPPGLLKAISAPGLVRSEEHTSELQSLMRISYAVFCLKKKNNNILTNIDKQKDTQQTYDDKTQKDLPQPHYIHTTITT